VFAIDPSANAIDCDGTWWRWGDLARIKEALEAILEEEGLGAGVRLGMLLRNKPAHVAALASIMSSARCVVTLNPVIPDDKLAQEIAALALPAIVASGDDWARPAVRKAAADACVVGIELPDSAQGVVRKVPGLDRCSATIVRDAPGIAIEMLTSGTTGTPKRIALKASLFEKMLNDATVYERDRQGDHRPRLRKGVNFVMIPFAHMGGMWSIMNTLVSGRQAFLIERFAVDPFIAAMRRHRPRALSTPPAILRMVLDANIAKEDLASIVAWRTSTAPLDPDIADLFLERYGIPVLQVYGATEFAGGVAGWTMEDFKLYGRAKRGSVGRLNPGIEGRVLDSETKEPLSPGTEGMLSLRAGHLGNGNDWIETTDRALLDADGFLWIKGRYDNAIIRGGFKILPDEVVKILEKHPAIREAAVAGIRDERLGEVPVAAYIVKTGAGAPNTAELREHLRRHLSPYQIPELFLAVAELPRTPSMKVSVEGVRALFESNRTAH
jgi:acyl-coenzyme A synthetase/AMP-(fatty) acid ligase